MTQQQSHAKAGWYDGKYWDGQAWIPGAVKQQSGPDSPWGWVCGGVVLTIAGFFVVYVGVDGDVPLVAALGYLLATFGGFMSLIGIIALGVILGGHRLDYERRARR